MLARALFFVFIYIPLLICAIPIQFVITRLGLDWNFLPRLFHRCGCIFLGIRVTMIGEPVHDRPTLLLSNHISWNDIISIGSKANVTFVAKSEIRNWFFVGFMASLQRTLYVDRKKRGDTQRASAEMGRRLASGGAVLLFAEGQSDVGTHVLPFRSALVGAAQHAMLEAGAKDVAVQPVTVAYTKLQGMPVSRTERTQISWAKSKSFKQNLRDMLGGPTKDVTVVFGAPIPLPEGADRKLITRQAEVEVRRVLVALNRGLPLDTALAAPATPATPTPVLA